MSICVWRVTIPLSHTVSGLTLVCPGLSWSDHSGAPAFTGAAACREFTVSGVDQQGGREGADGENMGLWLHTAHCLSY